MPGIRDLKGHPVEDALVSTDMRVGGVVAPAPPVVLPQAAKDAIARIRDRPRRERTDSERLAGSMVSVDLADHGGGPATTAWTPPAGSVPLPPDFEAGVQALEGAVGMVLEYARLCTEAATVMHNQMQALRARALRDAEKLAKVDAALKALSE